MNSRVRFLYGLRAFALSALLVLVGVGAHADPDYGTDAITAAATNGQAAILTNWKNIMPYALALFCMMLGWRLVRKMIRV